MSCFDRLCSVPFCCRAFVLLVACGLLLGAAPASSVAADPVQLTTDGRIKRDPVVWPNGKHVTYSTVTNAGVSRLMRLNLADGSTALFHPKETLPDRELTVSADGSVYAYVYVNPNGQQAKVIVRDSRRSSAITLEPGKFGLWPTLSPDGKHVAFTIDAGPLVTVDLDRIQGTDSLKFEAKSAGAVLRLTDEDVCYGDLWPKYSPDGSLIVFSSRRDDDFEIYLMNADGTSQLRLTSSPGIDTHPSFSPDGKQIVFTSNRDRNYEIYTMKLDGSDVRRITNHPGRDDFACWHPDGDRLILVSQRKGRYDLYDLEMGDQSAGQRTQSDD